MATTRPVALVTGATSGIGKVAASAASATQVGDFHAGVSL